MNTWQFYIIFLPELSMNNWQFHTLFSVFSINDWQFHILFLSNVLLMKDLQINILFSSVF